jgi:hypothetical protein
VSVTSFVCEPCSRGEISEFIEANHYSKSINGCISDYCFKLMDENKIIGAAFFGRMAMANQWKPYADAEHKVTELRRLCCVDETPKNTESFFIGKMLRWLKANTELEVVVSYSDLEYGHEGVIYKASNFKFAGFKKGAKVIWYQGRKYHDKTIRTKYKGELKPFAKRIKDALECGDAYYATTKGKNAYVYKL